MTNSPKLKEFHCAIALVAIFALTSAKAATEPPNLVPTKPAQAANYWCTWYAQNYWQQRGGEITDFKAINNPNAREELTYEHVFNTKDGWASTYLPRGRSDFFFLIDHGWQTKDPRQRIAGAAPFFSLQIDGDDFPKFAGTRPEESLRLFNEKLKSIGWRGLGIWTRGDVTEEAARTMVEWSKYADVKYWKIDGGGTKHYFSYKIKQEIFPELKLEYICGANGPLNQHWNDSGRTEYPSPYAPGYNKQKPALDILRNTDTFRTYDVAPLLVSTSTMRRVHDLLEQTQNNPEYIGILNLQDDPQVAAGMGCLVSSKRHPNYMERTYKGEDFHHQIRGKRLIQKRMNEVERFGRWQRIAPAFPAGVGSYFSSPNDLIDSYPHTKKDTWFSPCWDKMVYQSAPAVMSRNMPLPQVEIEGDPPHVMATTYPGGPLCIAVEGRVKPEDQWYEPRAKITVKVKDASQPIGIFGHYQQLVLEFAGPIDRVEKVWGQDLLADQASDITAEVKIDGSRLIIPGELIDRIGTSAGDKGDISVPGMVVRLDGQSLPVAGEDFVPPSTRRKATSQVESVSAERIDGYYGTAEMAKDPYGYRVKAPPKITQMVLKQLDKSIESGRVTITWKMKPTVPSAITKNGFLVLSADRTGTSSILAGSFYGAHVITIFENAAKWGNGPRKELALPKEYDCRLLLDMDARTAMLTINGVELKLTFSEAMTTVSYIGFGVEGADTLFTAPVIE